jgi:hypothetical protein
MAHFVFCRKIAEAAIKKNKQTKQVSSNGFLKAKMIEKE